MKVAGSLDHPCHQNSLQVQTHSQNQAAGLG